MCSCYYHYWHDIQFSAKLQVCNVWCISHVTFPHNWMIDVSGQNMWYIAKTLGEFKARELKINHYKVCWEIKETTFWETISGNSIANYINCLFNLHPEKWFEGYPVKSTQIFQGAHLIFFWFKSMTPTFFQGACLKKIWADFTV